MSKSVFGRSKVLKSQGISTATETKVYDRCLIISGICVAVLFFFLVWKHLYCFPFSYRNTLIRLKKKNKNKKARPPPPKKQHRLPFLAVIGELEWKDIEIRVTTFKLVGWSNFCHFLPPKILIDVQWRAFCHVDHGLCISLVPDAGCIRVYSYTLGADCYWNYVFSLSHLLVASSLSFLIHWLSLEFHSTLKCCGKVLLFVSGFRMQLLVHF